VEGIDGSGKSTQLILLERWMRSRGYPVHFTEWNSSALVRHSMQRGKKKNLLTPTTFSLLHAVDFADRLTYQILPPLKAGMIVLADRYVYTAFARDVARGVHPEWVRAVYSPALRPDLTLYFRVPIDISLERLLSGRLKIIGFFDRVRVLEIPETAFTPYRAPEIAFMNVNTPEELDLARGIAKELG